MQFDIITIFPHIFDSYFKESLIKKALDKKLLKIQVHNLRDYSSDKRKRVDDRPYGGGLGMVMMVEPVFKALKKIKKKNSRVILFTPRGKLFSQKKASRLKKYKQLVLICGRYEGIDERVRKLADEELSIGEYDLMGGEIPAMVVIETTARLIPEVIGKKDLLKERMTRGGGFVEYPQYTRPEAFNKWKVPRVLLSGNHRKIREWRDKRKKVIEK
ncbi:MAG: tRNA (guanosine(37)-N1)-methyltransferase TrmD [Candidatus Paceibacterota bacterium]|jgi:tRNA (guanine37-N1)-methyltransferase|nr:tRNA (guanosine(37)-N1)-methyltransferase TrmD [Candidatus Paceibacterota bacterium]MDD5555563.1 tRNA (guanosine(37)-N1)-methyltransferase TrmD [Candidatus Paceibacterota bacterium]